ncbi:MAG: hypothetical protein ACI8VC_002621 [Candidatus Endobugula sp.]|jgi:hypothetical protein
MIVRKKLINSLLVCIIIKSSYIYANPSMPIMPLPEIMLGVPWMAVLTEIRLNGPFRTRGYTTGRDGFQHPQYPSFNYNRNNTVSGYEYADFVHEARHALSVLGTSPSGEEILRVVGNINGTYINFQAHHEDLLESHTNTGTRQIRHSKSRGPRWRDGSSDTGNHTIFINWNSTFLFSQRSDTSYARYITLAHELTHSWSLRTGQAHPGNLDEMYRGKVLNSRNVGYDDSAYQWLELLLMDEAEVVGMVNKHQFNENQFREEFGWRPRLHYSGLNATDIINLYHELLAAWKLPSLDIILSRFNDWQDPRRDDDDDTPLGPGPMGIGAR